MPSVLIVTVPLVADGAKLASKPKSVTNDGLLASLPTIKTVLALSGSTSLAKTSILSKAVSIATTIAASSIACGTVELTVICMP